MNAPPRPVAHARRHRTRLLALGLFGALLGVPTASSAAVNPGHTVAVGSTDELVILEGYSAAEGPVTVEVLRGGVRIGTSGPHTVPPDGIVEINHPVDLGQTPTCFRDFTPDIVHGDVIRVIQGAGVPETSRVRRVTVTDPVVFDDSNPATEVVDVHGTAPEGLTGRLPVEELEVRLINPAFQGILGGRPFILAPSLGLSTLTYDTPTGIAWTARFTFTGPNATLLRDAALAAGTEAGWTGIVGTATEATEVGVAPEAPEPGLVVCPELHRAHAATQTTPNVTNGTGPLEVRGAAPLGTTSVSITISDGNPLTVDPTTSGTLNQPDDEVGAPVGGLIWNATVPANDLAPLDNTSLIITPTFNPGAITGVTRTVLKNASGLASATIASGPSEGSTIGFIPATFTFESDAHDVTFRCRVGAGAFSPCSTPHTIGPLPSGTYTLEVQAVDGTTPGPSALRTWNVDATPPDVAVTGGPSGSTALTSATFSMTSTDPTATFECRLDVGLYAACVSPTTFTSLAVGAHTVSIRARDAFDNVSAPTQRSWTVLGAPNTTLVAAPPATTTLTTATFGFTSDGPGATFECSLDGAAFSFCASPVNLSGLTIGSHTFRVRAVDTIGTADPTPAAHAWTVTLPDTERPDVRATIDPLGKLTIGRNGRLTVRGRCDERCTLFARATVSVPKLRGGKPTLYTLQSRTVDSAANTTSSVTLRLTGRQLAVVRNALKAGKSVRITITVVGRDSSGNRGSALRTIFLTKKNL